MTSYEKKLETQNEELMQKLAKAEKDLEKLEVKDKVYLKIIKCAWAYMRDLSEDVHVHRCLVEKIAQEIGFSQAELACFNAQELDIDEAKDVASRYMNNYLEKILNSGWLENFPFDDTMYEDEIEKIKDFTDR